MTDIRAAEYLAYLCFQQDKRVLQQELYMHLDKQVIVRNGSRTAPSEINAHWQSLGPSSKCVTSSVAISVYHRDYVSIAIANGLQSWMAKRKITEYTDTALLLEVHDLLAYQGTPQCKPAPLQMYPILDAYQVEPTMGTVPIHIIDLPVGDYVVLLEERFQTKNVKVLRHGFFSIIDTPSGSGPAAPFDLRLPWNLTHVL